LITHRAILRGNGGSSLIISRPVPICSFFFSRGCFKEFGLQQRWLLSHERMRNVTSYLHLVKFFYSAPLNTFGCRAFAFKFPAIS
jgi:hypothetical protein